VLLAAAACSAPVHPQPAARTAPPPAIAQPRAEPARACAAIRPRCDREIADAAVVALVERRCLGCHDAGGIAGHDFTSIAALRAAPVAEMIGSCQMPPDGAPVLAESDRRTLVDWSGCEPEPASGEAHGASATTWPRRSNAAVSGPPYI
jgi:hypothetical protein